ncbi:hypothetical protein V2J09_006688 [Rumex salicifolius]
MSFSNLPTSSALARITREVEKTTSGREFRVRDTSLADYGRRQIQLAESRMPGLTACRSEFGASQPLRGTRITGFLHMNAQTAVMIETLTALGAAVRWSSSNPFSTEDHAAAAVARDSASVFAWKGQSLEDYWWSLDKALDWGRESGPHLLVDEGGDATLFIHEGVKLEEEFERSGRFPESAFVEKESTRIMQQVIRDSIKLNPRRFRSIREGIVGVSEHTSFGIRRLNQLQNENNLFFPAINVNDAALRRIESIHGSYQSFLEALLRATDHATIPGSVAVVLGFGDVGRGCATSLRRAGAQVFVTEIDPSRALEAVMEGFPVRTLEDVVSQADFFVTATMNRDVITVRHMRQMKNDAIILNAGLYENEIDVEGLKAYRGVRRVMLKPLVSDRFVFSESNRGIIVISEGRRLSFGSASGQPSFVRSCSLTNHVMAQLELWRERASPKYQRRVYAFPRHLDEKVARQHLDKLGVRLTKLSNEQADYLNVPIEGPYKRCPFQINASPFE